MKKIIQYSLSLGVFLSAIFLSTSCEDTLQKDMVDDEVYVLKEGLHTIEVYNFAEAILPITIVKSGIGKREATASVQIQPELVQAYNTANNTNYKVLESHFYTLKNSTLNFDKSAYKQAFEVKIEAKDYLKLLADNPDNIYVLPAQVSFQNVGIEKKPVMEILAIPNIIEPFIGFNQFGLLNDANNINSKTAAVSSYYLKVSVNYPTSKDVLFALEQAVNAEVLVNQVNQDGNANYKLLPKEAYELKKNWDIKSGAKYTEVAYTVNKTKLVAADGKPLYGDYLLPLSITEVSENKINPDTKLVLIPFKYHE